MRPFYWRDTKNFGDFMNSWIWPSLFPNLLDEYDGIRLIGIGTLINSELELLNGKKVILGSGLGYGDIPTKDIVVRWKFYCVRGPLTAQLLGIDPRYAITDGAWLISLMPEFQTNPTKSGRIFVPHWTSDVHGVWERVCRACDIKYVSPLSESKHVIRQIASSELAIVESLHGAVIADYFRTPWIPVQSSNKILDFKWRDWCQSVGVHYRPLRLPAPDLFGSLNQMRKADVETEVCQADVSESQFRYRRVERPHVLYGVIQKAKPTLRAARSAAIRRIEHLRSFYPISIWDERSVAGLADRLNLVGQGTSYLSEDSVRGLRIEQLSEAVESLRKDYKAHQLR